MNRIKNYRTAARLVLATAMAGILFALPSASQAAAYFCTDLNPSGRTYSLGYGISRSQQVGIGFAPGDAGYHALLWFGTASSLVDLNPSGFTSSEAWGASGSQQVGIGAGSATGNEPHALLWSGTASNAVDLNPSGFVWSKGVGVSGSQQVGYGSPYGGGVRALLWSGSADSVVDLHPSRFVFSFSFAVGISGGQQVGGGTGFENHALLWSGTASSVVDLHPSGFTESQGIAISGSQQVGVGNVSSSGYTYHALLWSGTASSVVDLHSFLSSDYSESRAEGIDTNGTVVGSAFYLPIGQWHAMLWTRLPESLIICNDSGQWGAVGTYLTNSSITCIPPSGSFFPVGSNTVTCTTTTPATNYTFTVTVHDCEPPAIHSIAASPASLWPPNHKMQPVTLRVSATDNCHVAHCKIISVTSNETASSDWEITGDLTLNLRADRSGNGTGRVYTITVECADYSGNIATAVTRVVVPH